MKGLAESSPFHLLTNPHMINRFIFGHRVVIYYICCIYHLKVTYRPIGSGVHCYNFVKIAVY